MSTFHMLGVGRNGIFFCSVTNHVRMGARAGSGIFLVDQKAQGGCTRGRLFVGEKSCQRRLSTSAKLTGELLTGVSTIIIKTWKIKKFSGLRTKTGINCKGVIGMICYDSHLEGKKSLSV